MDPELANLNLDPPTQPSPLRRGLLPALLVHAAFFAALALSLQWNRDGSSDTLATRSTPTQNDTRSMGAPPAPVTEREAAPEAQPTPAASGQNGPSASPTPAPASVEPMQSTPPTPVRRPAERRSEATARQAAQASAHVVGATPVARTEPRPSFDCAKARSRSERLICSDPQLAALDRDTGRLHARAKAAARNPAAFRRQNDAEWKQREAQCRDKAC
ncbi:MAG TPA: hypothetical protein VGF26_10240, partial [Ramlibacter sp.]